MTELLLKYRLITEYLPFRYVLLLDYMLQCVWVWKPQTPHPLNAYNQLIDTDGKAVESESEGLTKVYETEREGDS